IQSQGGVSFKSGNYIKTGDGYISCVHVYKYQTLVTDFWLEQLMSMENALVTLDIATPNKKEMIEEINKTTYEQNTIYGNVKYIINRIVEKKKYRDHNYVY